MADADEITRRRNTCPNICKQCRPQCKMWQEISHLEGRTLMKYIKAQQEKSCAGGGLPHRIDITRPARSSRGLPSEPKTTLCCGACDVILEQISLLLDEIWDILGPEQRVQKPCALGRSGSCPCQHCMKHTSRGYAQGFGNSSNKERYVSWLKRLRPILLMVLEGVKRGRHQIYQGGEKDELEKLLEQLRIPLRKQARNIRITSLTNIPLSPTERDAGIVTSLIDNTDLLEKVLDRIKSESDVIETNLRQEKSESVEIHGRTGQLTPGNTLARNYDAEESVSTTHLPEHKSTQYYNAEGNFKTSHLPEHKPTHYIDATGTIRKAHLPEHKPTHYYDAQGKLRTAHPQEYKPTHYYDAGGNLRTAQIPEHKIPHYDAEGTPRKPNLPEHKPTHFIDAAGTIRKAHLPVHKPTHYYDAEGNLRTAYIPEYKPPHYDAEGTPRRAHLPEHEPTHYIDAADTIRKTHLSEHNSTHYIDAEGTRRKAYYPEHSPTHYYDAEGTPSTAHLPEHKPTHYYDAEGNLRTAQIPEHKTPQYYAEGTPRRPKLPEHKPTHYIDAAGTIRKAHLPEHKPTHYYDAEGNLRTAYLPEQKPTEETPKKAYLPEHRPTHYIDASGIIEKSHLPEHRPTHYYDAEGNLRTAEIPEHKLPHYNDTERTPRKAHLPEHKTAHYYDATNKQPAQKRSALKVLGNDNIVVFPPIFEKTMPDRKRDMIGGTKYTKEDKSEQQTGRTHHKKEDEMKLKRDAIFTIGETSDKKEHRAHFGKTEFAGKDRLSPPVESYDTQSPTTTDSRSHQRILKSRTTKETKQHFEMEQTGKRIVEMNEKEQKAVQNGDIQYGGRWPKESLPSRGDLFIKNASSEKDLKGIGGAKGHMRTGSDKAHASIASKNDSVKTSSNKDKMTTGSEKNHSRTRSNKERVITGSENDSLRTTSGKKDNVRTGSNMNQVRTGRDKGSDKDHEMDDGKTGDEKDREKTGGKKDGTKTGSEKGHEGGSETSLITQKDTSRKAGKIYYKGEAVAMKHEAEKGDLKVKVLKGGIETEENIKKVMQHPDEIDGVREVSKTELMSQKKNQASKKDTDVKRKRTVVSEVPSNIMLKRIKAEKLNELRFARKEAKMQRAPPPKAISTKSLPNVNVLLKKKKKIIRVVDSDSATGITECTELVVPPEMIQGDAVVPLETIVKHEHSDREVKPLLFEVEADVKDDEPLPFFPSIHALQSTSKMDHTDKSDKNKLTLKQFKQKTESPADDKGVIAYKLSNPQFIEMGYTKLPSVTVMRKTLIYKMVQPNPTEDWFRRNVHKRILYYDTCEKLAEIDENGYGCWYYKNGRVALQYYAAEQKYAKKRYIIYSSGENDENGKSRGVTVLATFDHVGNGIVYDHRGNMRLKYNQNEGENFDATIGATGRWKWHSMTTTLSASQNVYEEEHMRLGSQSTLNLLQQMGTHGVSSDELDHHHKLDKQEHIHMLTTEMENLMREKKELLQQKYQTFELKLKAFKLNEEFSLRIYEQTKIWLHFNVGCRNLKLNLGLRLISSNVIGTEMVHLNEINTPLDRDVPESESISNILDIISETRKQERKRKSGLRKYFPNLKNTASPLGRSRWLRAGISC